MPKSPCSVEIQTLETALENEREASRWRIQELETRVGVLESQLAAAVAVEAATSARLARILERDARTDGRAIPLGRQGGSALRLVHDCRSKQ